MRPARRIAWALVGALAAVGLACRAEAAGLLAEVDPTWSPFVRSAPAPGFEPLVREARELLATDPQRVARVLGKALAAGGAPRQVRGLRADALYQVGGDALWQAERGYRELLKEDLTPVEAAWCRFMLGNIQKGLGFPEAAEVEYRQALPEAREPWKAALRFNLGALLLETGRPAEAVRELGAWVRDYPGAPGRALALYLLGEALERSGEPARAAQRFREAEALDPDAWRARPETGYAMARTLLQEGEPARATAVLETLAEAYRGTPEAEKALLESGRIWEREGNIPAAARAYARLLDQGAGAEAAREARLRLALLGVDHADEVELTEPFPAYRIFYRPRPTLEEIAGGRDPEAAQRALEGLARLARKEEAVEEALRLLVRVFEDYPESPESGRAYEAFMDLLNQAVGGRLRSGDPVGAAMLFERFRASIRWVPTRDVGGLLVLAAEAYEAAGAPGLARDLYQEARSRGTRALRAWELDARILRTRAAEGDPDAVRRVAELHPEDWRAQVAWARILADRGSDGEARRAYGRALEAAPSPAVRYRIRVEADRVGRRSAPTRELLAELEGREKLWARLSQAQRDGLVPPPVIAGARLRFALGRYKEALQAYGTAGDTEDADRFLRALALARVGDSAGAREAWAALAEEGAAPYGPLGALSLEIDDLLESRGGEP